MSSKLRHLAAVLLSALVVNAPFPATAQMIELGTFGGNICVASNINNNGAAIGTCRETDGDIVAAFWGPSMLTPVSLAPLEAGSPCNVYDVNNGGTAAGNCEQGAHGEWFPVRWTTSLPDSSPQRLNPILGDVKAAAWIVNHAGVVAGVSIGTGGGSHAVIWNANQTAPIVLPKLGLLPPLLSASTKCSISDMTDDATPSVVGTCELNEGGSVAVRWEPGLLGYGVIELSRLPGGSNCMAAAINSDEFIAGTCENDDGDVIAVQWAPNDANMTYLDYLDEVGVSRQQLVVEDMNEAGVIVGNYITNDGFARAFVWAPNGDPSLESGLDLGSLGGARTIAVDIADNGMVAGDGQDEDGHDHAFRWIPSNGIEDLETLGGFDSGSSALSDNGLWQVGTSQVASGHQHAYVMEPAAIRRSKSVILEDSHGHRNGYSSNATNRSSTLNFATMERGSGVDATAICQAKGVSGKCLEYCAAQDGVPTNYLDYLFCLENFKEIRDAFKEARLM